MEQRNIIFRKKLEMLNDIEKIGKIIDKKIEKVQNAQKQKLTFVQNFLATKNIF